MKIVPECRSAMQPVSSVSRYFMQYRFPLFLFFFPSIPFSSYLFIPNLQDFRGVRIRVGGREREKTKMSVLIRSHFSDFVKFSFLLRSLFFVQFFFFPAWKTRILTMSDKEKFVARFFFLIVLSRLLNDFSDEKCLTVILCQYLTSTTLFFGGRPLFLLKIVSIDVA